MKLPADTKAELAVIGCCLLGGLDTAIDASDRITESSFFNEDCQKAWTVIDKMVAENKAIDSVTFAIAWSKEFGSMNLPTDILQCPDSVTSHYNIDQYVDSVVDMAERRRALVNISPLVQKIADITKPLSETLSSVESELNKRGEAARKIVSPKEFTPRFIAHLEERFTLNKDGRRSGLETGFYRYDTMTDGLQYCEQTIFGARPSQGKTALAVNITEHICLKNKVPTLFFSLEMSIEALVRRLCSSHIGIPLNELRRGAYTESVFARFNAFNAMLSKSNLYMVDATSGMDEKMICTLIRRAVKKYGIKLVVIDYLQKITASKTHEKRTYEVARVSGALKSAAISNKVAMLTLAQLNREPDKDKQPRKPRLSDLADSSQIERDGDVIALLSRHPASEDDRLNRLACLTIAKQRDGETGFVELTFNPEFTRFENPQMDAPTHNEEPAPSYDND